jgi:phosphoglucosamine mutase
MQLFGTSGVRRPVTYDLLDLSLKIGLAVGAIYKEVAIGRDTRTSSDAIRSAATAGLLFSGAKVADVGVLPTPTLAFTARDFRAGIMVTASHNPPQYNGLKLVNPNGSAFAAEQQQQISSFIDEATSYTNLSWQKMTNGSTFDRAIETHIQSIMTHFPQKLALKVVVDSGCGAAHFITPELLTRMGCEVIPLNCYANGVFPHDVEPIESNLGELMQAVKDEGADLGIAHDGDADRMMAVDNQGRFVTGDKLLAILARASGATRIITTIDASMSIDELGIDVERTRVGDPYVSEGLKTGGEFGGEPSGAWVFPQISLCPDGIYAAAQIAVIASKERLSELVDSLPGYPIVRGSVRGTVLNISDLKNRLLVELTPVSASSIDGLKLVFKEGWLLIRPSGTEPKIRLTAEARNESTAHQLYDRGLRIIEEFQRGQNGNT